MVKPANPNDRSGMQRELHKAVSRRLREARAARGLTQEEAAEACGVLAETISNIERGRALPSLPTLVQLAEGLSVSPTAFLEDVHQRARATERQRAESRIRIVSRSLSDREIRLLQEALSALRGLSEPQVRAALRLVESVGEIPRPKLRLLLEFTATLRKASAPAKTRPSGSRPRR